MENITSLLTPSLPEFRAFARKRLNEPGLAEEAVQDSFLKALKHAGQIKDLSRVKAWFYRILRRTIIDLYRRRENQKNVVAQLQEALLLHEDPHSPDPSACRCVDHLMPQMKSQYAELLHRLDVANEKLTEVAESLRISKNNATVRLHRARHQLKDLVTDNCGVCSTHGCLDCHCDIKPKEEN